MKGGCNQYKEIIKRAYFKHVNLFKMNRIGRTAYLINGNQYSKQILIYRYCVAQIIKEPHIL
jgi:hypothetical protein